METQAQCVMEEQEMNPWANMVMKLEAPLFICKQYLTVAVYKAYEPDLNIELYYDEMVRRLNDALEQALGFSDRRDTVILGEQKRNKTYGHDYGETKPTMTISMFTPEIGVNGVREKINELNKEADFCLKEMVMAILDDYCYEERVVPKPYTEERLRQNFLAHLKGLVDYWQAQPGDRVHVMQGLIHSVFSAIDGMTRTLPGFRMIASNPSENQFEDVTYCREHGLHWVYPFTNTDIAGSLRQYWHAAEVKDSDAGPLDEINVMRGIMGQEQINWNPDMTKGEIERLREATTTIYEAWQNRQNQLADATEWPKLGECAEPKRKNLIDIKYDEGDTNIRIKLPGTGWSPVSSPEVAADVLKAVVGEGHQHKSFNEDFLDKAKTAFNNISEMFDKVAEDKLENSDLTIIKDDENGIRVKVPGKPWKQVGSSDEAIQYIQDSKKQTEVPPWEDLPEEAGKNHDPLSGRPDHPQVPGHVIRKEEPK